MQGISLLQRAIKCVWKMHSVKLGSHVLQCNFMVISVLCMQDETETCNAVQHSC